MRIFFRRMEIMLKKINEQLENILLPHSISPECSIFKNKFLQMAGIEKKKDFQFHNDFSFTPNGLNWNELKTLFRNIGFDRKNYVVGQSIPIDEKVMFEKILPEFEKEIQNMLVNNPKEIRKYQLASKARLERTAVSKIQSITSDLLETLKNGDMASETVITLIKEVLAIQKIAGSLDENNHYDELLIETKTNLNDFVNATCSDTLKSQLISLQNAISEYEKFNLMDVKKSVRGFFKNIESFLSQFDISTATTNIFENILLKMAGIETTPRSCKIEKSYDRTHINLTIEGISESDKDQFLQWLLERDDSANLQNKNFSEERPQRARLKDIGANPHHLSKKKDIFYFFIDGKAISEIIYPQFQDQIKTLAEKGQLSAYQEASKQYIEKRNAEELGNQEAKLTQSSKYDNSSVLFRETSEPLTRKRKEVELQSTEMRLS